MNIILIILIGYILPALLGYWYIRLAFYHPRGEWKVLEPTMTELLIVIAPIVNWVSIFFWMFQWPIKGIPKGFNIFKPKSKP